MPDASLKTLFDTLPESILITNEKGLVVYTNPAMSERTGFSVAEIIGKKSGALWGGHMDSDFYRHFWKKIADRKEPFIGQVTNQYKNKKIEKETVSVAPIIDREQKIHYFIELIPKTYDRTFYETFETLFSNQLLHENDIVKWITRVPRKEDVFLTDTMREELIVPTEKQFIPRWEDRNLVEAAQINAKTFSELYLKYHIDIKKYFLYHLNNKDEVEDLTQETFIRAFRFLPHFTISNASYLTYLKRIAHNLLANYYRDKKQTVSLEEIQEQPNPDEHILDHLFYKETIARLLASVTPFERELLTQRYIEGLSIRDIAIHLDKTENSVKLTLSRLKKKIKK